MEKNPGMFSSKFLFDWRKKDMDILDDSKLSAKVFFKSELLVWKWFLVFVWSQLDMLH